MEKGHILLLKKQLEKKDIRMVCKGDSMYPTIKSEEYIHITKIDSDKIKEGDIVAYIFQNNIIAHRIIKLGEEEIYVRGDNMKKEFPLSKKDILGLVILEDKDMLNE